MKLVKNEIRVHRGETFTLDFTVVNPDGSPYILYKELQNPYVLINVSSSKYDQTERYSLNMWLDLSAYPKFPLTVPLIVNGEDDIDNMTVVSLPTAKVDEDENGIDDVFEAVYYMALSSNNKYGKYLYYLDTDLSGTAVNDWVEYSFRIIVPFTTEIVNQWKGQNYEYSVSLVTGESTREHLEALHFASFGTSEEDRAKLTMAMMYNDLKALDEKLVEHLDVMCPIAVITDNVPFIKPTKLTVYSN